MDTTPQKVALVTGANKGIGFEITRQLCFKGYSVWMAARNASRLAQSAGMLRGEGHDVIPVELDVTNPTQLSALMSRISDEKVTFDALINNAAVLHDGELNMLEVDAQIMMDTLHTNSVAPLQITRAMLPHMRDGSRIVMMSSGSGVFCEELSNWAPVYSMSKTLVNAVTRQLAPLLKPRNIAINAVCPGWVKTSMGGPNANRHVSQGAETPVWLATEVEPTVTGKFWRDKKEIGW